MSYKPTFFCSVCGSEKKVANHWLLAEIRDGKLIIQKWDNFLAKEEGGVFHLCGAACGHAKLNEFIEAKEEQNAAHQ